MLYKVSFVLNHSFLLLVISSIGKKKNPSLFAAEFQYNETHGRNKTLVKYERGINLVETVWTESAIILHEVNNSWLISYWIWVENKYLLLWQRGENLLLLFQLFEVFSYSLIFSKKKKSNNNFAPVEKTKVATCNWCICSELKFRKLLCCQWGCPYW